MPCKGQARRCPPTPSTGSGEICGLAHLISRLSDLSPVSEEARISGIDIHDNKETSRKTSTTKLNKKCCIVKPNMTLR
jgi:hypothetical protein